MVAQDEMDATSMTCAEFTAMDPDNQMRAVEAMEMASADPGMMAESEEVMTAEDDAMAAEGSMMADPEAMTPEGGEAMMAKGNDGTSSDPLASIRAACEGHPDMMVMDATKSAAE